MESEDRWKDAASPKYYTNGVTGVNARRPAAAESGPEQGLSRTRNINSAKPSIATNNFNKPTIARILSATKRMERR